ncbi:MAG: lysine biosynthesis protein LysX [Thermoproteota archaeon]|nr:lysine biosynthesis protein LysX [Candidatus Brockarchaeota archaeon]
MTTVGLVYDLARKDEKMIVNALNNVGANVKLIDSRTKYFTLVKEENREEVDIYYQRSISYFRALYFNYVLEKFLEARVINSYEAYLLCGNKLLTTVNFIKNEIPTPRTIVSFDSDSALEVINKQGFPLVLKPVIGSWGRLVAPLNDLESAKSILETRQMMHPIYQVYYIQERIRNLQRDLRVVVVGDKPVAAEYRYATNGEWRTNLARGGKAIKAEITEEVEKIVEKIIKAFGKGIYGIDFMENERGLLAHEVNPNVEFKGVSEASRVDVAKEIANYLLKEAKR